MTLKTLVASLPEMVKPASAAKQRTNAAVGTSRGGMRERMQKDCQQRRETRSNGGPVPQVSLGINNQAETLERESDGFVVAEKRSNVRGAKEPWLHTRQH